MSEIEVFKPPKLNGKALVDWLAAALKAAGYNQTELAKGANMSPVQINKILKGTREISGVELIQFAVILGAELPAVTIPGGTVVSAAREDGGIREDDLRRAIRGAFEALEVAGKPITAASVSELAGLLYDLDDH